MEGRRLAGLMSDLFAAAGLAVKDAGNDVPQIRRDAPLAERLRPRRLVDVVGQDHLVGPDGALTRLIDKGGLSSLILWGPPGVGKTTIARLLAFESDLELIALSAVFSGVADLRRAFEAAETRRKAGRRTLLFVDEIHRFNRAQQDAFLGPMESGGVILIGATTENPSFALNAALLSRAKVLTLKRLDPDAIDRLLARAEQDAGRMLPLLPEARAALIAMADGDGRYALNLASELFSAAEQPTQLSQADLEALAQRRALSHDRAGEFHYDLASALQKSIRGSDVDAALYWAARMLAGGEDPRFILRRLIVIASEDIGNADARALPLAIAASQAYERLGQPEGEIAIGQLVAFLAAAPKSNRAHVAFKQAKAAAAETGSLSPPRHAVNAPTQMMKEFGYGAGYAYDHDVEGAFAGLDYFPEEMPRRLFYQPRDEGDETAIGARMAEWARLRGARKS